MNDANNIKDVKVVGFDLDQTLYPKMKEIDDAIQEYIHKVIAKHKNCSIEEAQAMFSEHYPEISGRKTLMMLGIPDAADVVQRSLENADITAYLKPNPDVINLLKDIKQKYGTLYLVTGSYREAALQKLASLDIPESLFDGMITGEISKSDGTAFRKWREIVGAKLPGVRPAEFLYIGDRKSTDVDIPCELGMQAVLVNVKEKDDSIEVLQFTDILGIRSLLL